MEFVLSQRNPLDRNTGLNPNAKRSSRDRKEPGWADGLRKLYDSVVDEPLPDSFEELLKKLDK